MASVALPHYVQTGLAGIYFQPVYAVVLSLGGMVGGNFANSGSFKGETVARSESGAVVGGIYHLYAPSVGVGLGWEEDDGSVATGIACGHRFAHTIEFASNERQAVG